MFFIMKKNSRFIKVMIISMLLLVAKMLPACYAESVTENNKDANSEITLRIYAPVYTGPVEGNLEELTQNDFEKFGNESEMPNDQYRRYRKILEQHNSEVLIPYKMRIIDRDLTLNDFFGFGVSEDVSEARYEGYLDMNPVTVDGRTIHYVYVYHKPFTKEEVEYEAAGN